MKKLLYIILVLIITTPAVMASSHREAPFVTEHPKVDGTDLYAFNSYETGREGFVTIIANYDPLQDAYGGPNYFNLDPSALYDIKIDNDGDAKEDLTLRLRFNNTLTGGTGVTLPINGVDVAIPLVTAGAITFSDQSLRSRNSTYTMEVVTGSSFAGGAPRKGKFITKASDSSKEFDMPEANIGTKTFANYAAYADNFTYEVTIPGCDTNAKVFVGQRKEPFQVNLGEIFDLVNLNPLGSVSAEVSDTADKNITTIAIEVKASCLSKDADTPIIGVWTSSSLPATRVLSKKPSFLKPFISSSNYVQTSRLGMPLVNEVVIGLKDKDRFNASEPSKDAQFATYVTNPTLPAILQSLFGVTAPTKFPRTDLIAVFLTGVEGLNQPANVVASEMLRLNTSTTPVVAASQNNLGVIAGDNAGFPNGRRPGDDVVDVALRVVMGVLLGTADAPSGALAYTDGAIVNAAQFDSTFPYLKDPIAGSPN